MRIPAPRTIGLRTTEVTYPGGTEHIRTVRADLRAVLDAYPRADDVILCASELAANAVQYSRSHLPGGTFAVRTVISPDHYARIEVQDGAAPGTSPWSTRRGITAWTSFVRLPTNGGSTAITPAAPSGRDSTGPSSRNQARWSDPSGVVPML